MLKGIISKINGSAGNLTFMQTGGQTIVSESPAWYKVVFRTAGVTL